MTLVEFLTARYDEIEASADAIHVANDSSPDPGVATCDSVPGAWRDPGLCDCGVPDQTRRRITAARGIIRWATDAATDGADGFTLDVMQPLRHLAAEFTDHPDHRPEWNPS